MGGPKATSNLPDPKPKPDPGWGDLIVEMREAAHTHLVPAAQVALLYWANRFEKALVPPK